MVNSNLRFIVILNVSFNCQLNLTMDNGLLHAFLYENDNYRGAVIRYTEGVSIRYTEGGL